MLKIEETRKSFVSTQSIQFSIFFCRYTCNIFFLFGNASNDFKQVPTTQCFQQIYNDYPNMQSTNLDVLLS